MIIENSGEVADNPRGEVGGVARRSALTAVRIPFASVWLIEAMLLFNPTGSNPKIAVRQNALKPMAMATSTSEKAAVLIGAIFTV